jgi:hypothetical protein
MRYAKRKREEGGRRKERREDERKESGEREGDGKLLGMIQILG